MSDCCSQLRDLRRVAGQVLFPSFPVPLGRLEAASEDLALNRDAERFFKSVSRTAASISLLGLILMSSSEVSTGQVFQCGTSVDLR